MVDKTVLFHLSIVWLIVSICTILFQTIIINIGAGLLVVIHVMDMDVDSDNESDNLVIADKAYGTPMMPPNEKYFDFLSIARGNYVDNSVKDNNDMTFNSVHGPLLCFGDNNPTYYSREPWHLDDFQEPYEQDPNYLRFLNNNEFQYLPKMHNKFGHTTSNDNDDNEQKKSLFYQKSFQKEFNKNKNIVPKYSTFATFGEEALTGNISEWPTYILQWFNDTIIDSQPAPPQSTPPPQPISYLPPVSPSNFADNVQQSIRFKEQAPISQFVRPDSKLSKENQKKRDKKYKGKDTPTYCTASDDDWTKALKLYFDDKVGLREICRRLPKINFASLSRYIGRDYRTTAEIPRSGPVPMIGDFGDSLLAGHCRMKAHHRQAINDKDIRFLAAELYNSRHDVDRNVIDLTTENPIRAKQRANRRYPKHFRYRHPKPRHRRPRRITNTKKAALKNVNPGQRNLAAALEKIGMKEKGCNIYPWALDRIAVADEINNAPKENKDKCTSFGDEIELVGHKMSDINHSTLFATSFISGRNDFPPTIICPAKKYLPDKLFSILDKEWKNCLVACSKSSFNNGTLFCSTWDECINLNLLVPKISNTTKGRVVMILDGHKSRYYDYQQVLRMKEMGFWFWLTPPNLTFVLSALDQDPFKEYHRLYNINLPIAMKSLGYSTHNIEVEVLASIRAWKEVTNPGNGYISAGVKMSGLHPFKHHFENCDEDPLEMKSNDNDKQEFKSVHDVHRCGGWLHDPNVIKILKKKK
eukprot:318232_1